MPAVGSEGRATPAAGPGLDRPWPGGEAGVALAAGTAGWAPRRPGTGPLPRRAVPPGWDGSPGSGPSSDSCSGSGLLLAGMQHLADAAQQRVHRGGHDVLVNGDAGEALTLVLDLDVGHGLRLGALAERVLAVLHDLDVQVEGVLQRVDEGFQHALPLALHLEFAAVHFQGAGDAPLLRLVDAEALEGDRRGQVQVVGLEQLPDALRRDFLAGVLGGLLHHAAELDLQPARQREAVLALHDVGHAALAGLAVDADHVLVAAADVARVDRQV